MPTRAQLLALVRAGHSYEEIGARVGILPGQAYLIATGLPADGSDVLPASALEGREGLLPGSTQHLANPPTSVPTTDPSIERWMKARAAADEPMRAAAIQRTAEPPRIRGEGASEDVLDVLGWDHNQVRYLQEQLEAVPGVRVGGSEAKQQARVSLVDMIRVRLARHETAEEEVLWPAVRSALSDGDAVADRALEQEQRGKDVLQALAGVGGGEDRFDGLVETLVAALRQHVAFEDSVFLRLRSAMAEEDRAELGRRVIAAERGAPTRPHPHAPTSPGALKAAAAGAGALDRLRDRVGHRPAERSGTPEGQQTPDDLPERPPEGQDQDRED